MHIKINYEVLPKRIVFCRHAQSIGNALRLDDNSLEDTPNHGFHLTKRGIKQAQETAAFLRKHSMSFSEHYVSTFKRTQLTHQILFPEINRNDVYEDPRIDEWWKGIFHSLSKEQITEHYQAESQVAKREGWYQYRPPQGEAGKDVELRILNFLSQTSPEDSIFICGHGRWFSFLERILLSLPRYESIPKAPVNCALIEFERTGNSFQKNKLFVPHT